MRICTALPVVVVVTGIAGDRHASQGRRVGVVEPVLEVEVAGARAGAVGAAGLLGRPRHPRGSRPRGRRPSPAVRRRSRAPSHVPCRRRRRCSRQRRKSTGIARDPCSKRIVGMCRRTSFADLGPIGGDQRRLVPAPVGHRHRAEHPRGEGACQRRPPAPVAPERATSAISKSATTATSPPTPRPLPTLVSLHTPKGANGRRSLPRSGAWR